jgi:hypothetical protein
MAGNCSVELERRLERDPQAVCEQLGRMPAAD